MKCIWKYTLERRDRQQLQLPGFHAKPLAVGMQNGSICLWAEVEVDGPKFGCNIVIVGTGREIPLGCEYIGTVFDGSLVWHVHQLLPGNSR